MSWVSAPPYIRDVTWWCFWGLPAWVGPTLSSCHGKREVSDMRSVPIGPRSPVPCHWGLAAAARPCFRPGSSPLVSQESPVWLCTGLWASARSPSPRAPWSAGLALSWQTSWFTKSSVLNAEGGRRGAGARAGLRHLDNGITEHSSSNGLPISVGTWVRILANLQRGSMSPLCSDPLRETPEAWDLSCFAVWTKRRLQHHWHGGQLVKESYRPSCTRCQWGGIWGGKSTHHSIYEPGTVQVAFYFTPSRRCLYSYMWLVLYVDMVDYSTWWFNQTLI